MRIQEGYNNKEISFVGLNFVFPKKNKTKQKKSSKWGRGGKGERKGREGGEGGEGRGRGRGGKGEREGRAPLCSSLFYASMFTPAKLAFKIKKENISFEFSW